MISGIRIVKNVFYIFINRPVGFNPESKIYATVTSRQHDENNGVWLEEGSWVTVSRSSRCLDNSSGGKKRMKMRLRKWTNLVCPPVSVGIPRLRGCLKKADSKNASLNQSSFRMNKR